MMAKDFCEKHKVSITHQSVPLRKDDAKGSFRYVVTVHYAGKALTVDYWKGSAHVGTPIYDGANKIVGWKMASRSEIKEYEKKVLWGERYVSKFKPIPPQVNEFIYCLASDAQLIDDYPLWEDFAYNLGMNVDSIKDKSSFDECVKQYMRLRALFGSLVLNELMQIEDE